MSGHQIRDNKAVLVTSSASLVTFKTITEDDLGHSLMSDNYVVGIDWWILSRAGNYTGYVKGRLSWSRIAGDIKELAIATEGSQGGCAPTVSVADGDPDILIQITPGSSADTVHRMWLDLRTQNDAIS